MAPQVEPSCELEKNAPKNPTSTSREKGRESLATNQKSQNDMIVGGYCAAAHKERGENPNEILGQGRLMLVTWLLHANAKLTETERRW